MSFRYLPALVIVGLITACSATGPTTTDQSQKSGQDAAAGQAQETQGESQVEPALKPAPQETADSQAQTLDNKAGQTGTQAVVVDPETAARMARATDQFEAVLTAMQAGDDNEAEQGLVRMTLDYPELAGPYVNLGILHMRAGMLDTARADFIKALSLNPENATSLNHLGIISREQGHFQEALDYYQEALTIAPDYANAHLNLGILLDLYMGNQEQALVHYKQYQALTNDTDDTVRNWIVDLGRRVEQP